MNLSDVLTISQLSCDDNQYCFECIGSVDTHAQQVLQELRDTPPAGAAVALDFAKVERVNSMGLSLLLKVFEHWEAQSIRIEVRNLNRMVSMLFKITGLGRFIQGADAAQGGAAGAKKIVEPTRPVHSEHAPGSASVGNSKLNFVASLQSGSQLSGWYLLNTYLQRRTQRVIHFEQRQDVKDGSAIDLFFAKPFEACAMMREKGFVPLMRPIGEADEVVILMRANEEGSFEEFGNANVVTAHEGSFVYLLGRFLCDESGLDSAKFNFQFAGNEIKALQMLIRKQADVLFMLKKTYEGLSSLSRQSVRLHDESNTDFAFHLFCVAPHVKDNLESVGDVLRAMQSDEQGAEILKDIDIQGWCKPEEGELNMLQTVFERYVV
ncbi:MAG: PhnD/SsuA/transferrin family substrate-binding protein [Gammaproteobacteria bacterium]